MQVQKIPIAVRLLGFEGGEAARIAALLSEAPRAGPAYVCLHEDSLQEPDIYLVDGDNPAALLRLGSMRSLPLALQVGGGDHGLARLDRPGEPSAHTGPIDIYPIVAELLADFWPLAHARGQHLEVLGLTRLKVQADSVEMGILLRNLLDNALRYTPDGGCVDVELSRHQGRPQLIIRDTGPGIPDALLDKVTERFRRASDQRTTGSGLGLSIALELARRQHAWLSLTNRQPHGLEVRLVWEMPGVPG